MRVLHHFAEPRWNAFWYFGICIVKMANSRRLKRNTKIMTIAYLLYRNLKLIIPTSCDDVRASDCPRVGCGNLKCILSSGNRD
eukprot:SAG31_NODE_4449_length_3222_cov_1.382325_4_plen_83_part_00